MSENNPFNVIGNAPKQETGSEARPIETGSPKERYEQMINSNDIFVFMKGNPDFPQCGFSANTVAILNHLGQEFSTFDILTDGELRSGIKEWSEWPTFPQLYHKGGFLGGNDIITEMYESGQLAEVLANNK